MQERMLQEQTAAKEELQNALRETERAALDAIAAQREAYEGTIRDMAEGGH